MCDTAHREPHRADPRSIGRGCSGGGYEREFVGLPITNLEVMRCTPLDSGGHFNSHNEISATKYVVAFWCIAWQAMKFSERNRPFSAAATHQDNRIQGRKCHGHVRRMSGDAFIR